MSNHYRLVYASQNLLTGTEDDTASAVMEILTTSQRNNAAVGITGALLFNKGAFAQVLEGPQHSVEETFERIQQDVRHGEVTVLQCGLFETRGFANWSMAFVGRSTRGQALWSELAAKSGFDLSRLDGDQVFSMLHDLVSEEEGIAAMVLEPNVSPASSHGATLNVTKLRAELADLHPEAKIAAGGATSFSSSELRERSSMFAGSDDTPAIGVLKACLRTERLANVDLRGENDDLQIALALQTEQIEAITKDRDTWAERVRILATALSDKVEAVTSTGKGSAIARNAAIVANSAAAA